MILTKKKQDSIKKIWRSRQIGELWRHFIFPDFMKPDSGCMIHNSYFFISNYLFI